MSGQTPDPFGLELIKAGASGLDAKGRRRVHPLTPWIKGFQVAPIALVVVGSLSANAGLRLGGGMILATIAGIVVLAAVVAGFAQIGYRNLSFWFDDDGDLRIDSGVITKNERRLQLSRLQSVDVVQPLVARLVGLAEVRIEVAGSGDSRAVLQYLAAADARDLRNELIARSAGLSHDAGEAPEQVIANVPASDLLLSLLFRGQTFMLLLFTIAIVLPIVLSGNLGGLVFLVFTGVPLFGVFTEFSRFYGFTVADSQDGLRLRHGLLQTAQQTVPPGRVQAVGFHQSLLWRRKDWVRVQLNIAGVASGAQGSGDQSYVESVLLPVAPWHVAREVVARVLPGVDLASLPLIPAPRRSRRRAWIQWGELGVAWDDHVFVTRRGRFSRDWSVLPHARTQSVRVTQGPWQRQLGLASMSVDTTPGGVQVVALHRDADEARMIAEQQLERARVARATDRSTHWGATTFVQSPVEAQPPLRPESGEIT